MSIGMERGFSTVLVIGLTGGIASGKSTISNYLRELGAVVIDADQLAREVVKPHSPAWQEIKGYFGDEVIDEQGNIDRRSLGRIIFHSPRDREKLNSIIHPKVIEATKVLIDLYNKRNEASLVVVDAPLLLEAGMTDLVDEVWVAAVPEEVQIERLMKRDKVSREEALARLKTQMPLEEKLGRADRVIDNSGDPEKTREQVFLFWKGLIQE